MQLRAQINELRRLRMCQEEINDKTSNELIRIKAEVNQDLYHSDLVLAEGNLIKKKTEDLVERNHVEIEDSEQLLEDYGVIVAREEVESKAFYERQMKETPHFDDSFKDNMLVEIKNAAAAVVDAKQQSVDIDERLRTYEDAFRRLRAEVIGDESLGDAIAKKNKLEEESFALMHYVRTTEMEIEVTACSSLFQSPTRLPTHGSSERPGTLFPCPWFTRTHDTCLCRFSRNVTKRNAAVFWCVV